MIAHALHKLKHTWSAGILVAQTRPPTHTDGLRDASTIKLIHLKSPTVTSRWKPAAGSRCSLRHVDSSALCRASQGLSVWPSPFLITPESSEQLLLFHICVSINQACEGAYVKQTSHSRPSLSHAIPLCLWKQMPLILCQFGTDPLILNLLFRLPTDVPPFVLRALMITGVVIKLFLKTKHELLGWA